MKILTIKRVLNKIGLRVAYISIIYLCGQLIFKQLMNQLTNLN